MKNPKIPQTVYPINKLFTERWSARAFTSQPIAEQTLMGMFEAASWAASSMNEQPWLYYYAHKEDDNFQKFVDCLLPGNAVWAQHATVLVLSLAKKTFAANGATNRHALYDTGAANTNLMLQATEHGLTGHQMGGFDYEKTREMFQLSDDIEPVVFIALGYPGQPDQLEEPFKSRETTPRTRKPISSFVQKFEVSVPVTG